MNSRRKWALAALVVAAVLSVVSIADGEGFRRYLRLRREMASLQERNRILIDENKKLLRNIAQLRTDDRALERAAREELGFIKPGEVIFNLE